MNKQEIEKAIEVLKRKSTIPNDGESFEDIEKAYNIAISALEHQLTNGWKSQKRIGEWEEICSKCLRGGI